MGLSFASMTRKGPTHDEIIAWFERTNRRAAISPTVNGVTTVFEYESRRGGILSLEWETNYRETDGPSLSQEASQALQCPLLAVEVFDDDDFEYELYDCGNLIDHYACPYYVRLCYTSEASARGGNAIELYKRFGISGSIEEVERILHEPGYRPTFWTDPYYQAQDQHTVLVTALGLPSYAKYQGYSTWGGEFVETHPQRSV